MNIFSAIKQAIKIMKYSNQTMRLENQEVTNIRHKIWLFYRILKQLMKIKGK